MIPIIASVNSVPPMVVLIISCSVIMLEFLIIDKGIVSALIDGQFTGEFIGYEILTYKQPYP